jgi:succinoglycan biosynthesis transport protein ExoP
LPETSNLDVILAGPIPPYPAELLGSHRMKTLIALWRTSYEHVIIDTPPVLSVTDAVLLSVDVDSVVVVVRSGKTTKRALREVSDVLSLVNTRTA